MKEGQTVLILVQIIVAYSAASSLVSLVIGRVSATVFDIRYKQTCNMNM